ncbi:MAG TPA: hypothetical protein VLA78_07820, partial [Paracoccaceae bacterium]|nr:hypothetical protein [Paracoccaceae bacterium]
MRRLPALALMLALPWLAACLPGGAGPEPVGQPVEAISVIPLPDPGAAPADATPPEATPPAD